MSGDTGAGAAGMGGAGPGCATGGQGLSPQWGTAQPGSGAAFGHGGPILHRIG
jgi:hypothetical protein